MSRKLIQHKLNHPQSSIFIGGIQRKSTKKVRKSPEKVGAHRTQSSSNLLTFTSQPQPQPPARVQSAHRTQSSANLLITERDDVVSPASVPGGGGEPALKKVKSQQQLLITSADRSTTDRSGSSPRRNSKHRIQLKNGSANMAATKGASAPPPIIVNDNEDGGGGEDNSQQQDDHPYTSKYQKNGKAKKKWTSALRIVSAMTRFKNAPKVRNPQNPHGGGGVDPHQAGSARSRGSSFSGSNDSTMPFGGRGGADQEPETIDPVYLALKQATEKYGTPEGSRRGSENVVAGGELETPSPRNMSHTSLHDSGTFSSSELCSSRQPLVGSTPQLHGIPLGKVANGGSPPNSGGNFGNNNVNNETTTTTTSTTTTFSTNNKTSAAGGGRKPKLAEKMKSLSLDCAEMPAPPMQNGIRQQYKTKPVRSARGLTGQSFDKGSTSPPSRPSAQQPGRRLPATPVDGQQQQPQLLQKEQPLAQKQNIASQQPPKTKVLNLHIVTHEYIAGECSLRPADRVVVVDNGDPDWKHGFKLNDGLEKLLTFPSSCVAAYRPEEQPMQLVQSCNLSDQKIRLYRDQVVFAQPDSLSEDGRVLLIRNEHNKFAHCPLQFLTMA